MSTRRSPAPRGAEAAFLGACLLLVLALVPGALIRGEVLSQSQWLYDHAPWSAHVPPGVPPINDFLVDPPTVFYPFLVFAAETVRDGRLPLWAPGLYGGHPFLASFQSAVLSPFAPIAYALPLPFATVPLALAPLLVGAVGMRRLVRVLGGGEPGAWFGGLAWLLNGFAIVWFEHPLTAVACWLPWLLVAVDRVVEAPRAGSSAWLACAVAAAILSGHPETVMKVLMLVAAWALHRAWGRPRAAWLALAAGGAAGVLLSAVQIVPFAEYLLASEAWMRRAAAGGNTMFMPAATAITALVPDFLGNPADGAYLPLANRFGIESNYGEQQAYAGAVTLLLAPIGLVAGWRDGRTRFFAAAFVVSLALMYGTPGLLAVVSRLPVLRVSILSRFGLLAILSAIVLASRGVDALAADRGGADVALRRALTWSIAVTLGAIVVWTAVFRDTLAGAGLGDASLRACIQAAGVLLAGGALARWRLHGRLGPRPFAAAICTLVALELSVTAHGFHKTMPSADVLPVVPAIAAVRDDAGLARVYGWGTALAPNTAMAYGLQDARGWDGVGPARYTRLLDLGYLRQARDPGRHLADPVILDLLNVKYVFVPPGVRLAEPRFVPVRGAPAVYENTRVQPRAFLAASYRVLDDRDLEGTLHARRADLRTTVLLERDLAREERPDPAAPGRAGSARINEYRDTAVEIATEADGRRLLVLADAHYPGWRASVDGTPVPIHRADYAVRAVSVPPGRHVVRFEYAPWTLRVGAALSLGQALVLVVAVLVARRRSTSRG